MRASREATVAFRAIYDEYFRQWDEKDIAYDKAEQDWVAKYGKRKYRCYKSFMQVYNRGIRDKKVRPKRGKSLLIARFFEIFDSIADRNLKMTANYERAEQVYQEQFGTRRFSSYSVFSVTKSRLKKAA